MRQKRAGSFLRQTGVTPCIPRSAVLSQGEEDGTALTFGSDLLLSDHTNHSHSDDRMPQPSGSRFSQHQRLGATPPVDLTAVLQIY
ncbi:hypothetical protein J6590_105053 [Homalodisca vitripennis]|nr:hypothetical protein J6590_105053 [Homalodisca vitripennis]